MAPVFAHGQLRLYLLALLEPGAKHGYELITALSNRFGGTYRPSAGTIYPRLARLEEEGLVRRNEDGRKSTYELTDAGQRELDARRGDLATLELGLAETVRSLADQVRDEVQGAMRGLRADLACAAQSARASATPSPTTIRSPEERLAGRARLAEAEALLDAFRNETRDELRQARTDGGIGQLSLDTLRAVLESGRTAIRATVR